MKTIFDVISKYRAEWPTGMASVIKSSDMDVITFAPVGFIIKPSKHKVLFTRKDFENLVHHMKFNFNAISMDQYYNYINSVKEKIGPIYTQEMFDNGELPSVGMLIKHQSVKKIIIAGLDSNNNFALKSVDKGIYQVVHIDDIKPLTPPIELTDGECYQFTSPSGTIRKGYYIPVKDMFICANGNIDASRATNIQPLTVGN
jgi:hypothetical protein